MMNLCCSPLLEEKQFKNNNAVGFREVTQQVCVRNFDATFFTTYTLKGVERISIEIHFILFFFDVSAKKFDAR